MCNCRPVQSVPAAPADTTNDEEKRQPPQTLNPREKAILAKLFMHNSQFAKTFFEARIGVSPEFLLFRLFPPCLVLHCHFGRTIEKLTYRRRGYDAILCPSSTYVHNVRRGINDDDGSKSRRNLDTLVEIL